MRLLNTSTLQLGFFIGSNTPPYVILSHTWEEEEVLFDDIQNGNPAVVAAKKGFVKVKGCCEKAAADGFEWVWIDTCCIDKSSSAELSEAINSMFAWYQKSIVCYAYLQDVTASSNLKTAGSFSAEAWKLRAARFDKMKKAYPSCIAKSGTRNLGQEASRTVLDNNKQIVSIRDFAKSCWFTRGWTLQELIAPKVVEFYTMEWEGIGTRGSLPAQLANVTGIPERVLRGEHASCSSVAERMSWAAKRQMTREEDMAYCLLGLFGVNMPLLYGEGTKSFNRLQE